MENTAPTNKLLVAIIVLLSVIAAGQTWYIFSEKAHAESAVKAEPIAPPEPKELPKAHSWFDMPFDSKTWDPFQEMQDMQDRMNKMFNYSISKFNSSSDFNHLFQGSKIQSDLTVKNEKDKFIVTMSLPDSNKNNVSVKVDGQQLTISGNVTKESSENGHSQSYSSSFTRSVTLPEPVQPGSMSSKFEDGIVAITINKAKRDDSKNKD